MNRPFQRRRRTVSPNFHGRPANIDQGWLWPPSGPPELAPGEPRRTYRDSLALAAKTHQKADVARGMRPFDEWTLSFLDYMRRHNAGRRGRPHHGWNRPAILYARQYITNYCLFWQLLYEAGLRQHRYITPPLESGWSLVHAPPGSPHATDPGSPFPHLIAVAQHLQVLSGHKTQDAFWRSVFNL